MRCKVGDLVVVSGLSHPKDFSENLGRFGTVVRPTTSDEQMMSSGKHEWVVKPQSTFIGWRAAEQKKVKTSECVTFGDRALTPIRPGDLVEETETALEKETV